MNVIVLLGSCEILMVLARQTSRIQEDCLGRPNGTDGRLRFTQQKSKGHNIGGISCVFLVLVLRCILPSLPQTAHTRYQKPVCYAATFVQPFAFDIRVNESAAISTGINEPKLYMMENLYTTEYKSVFAGYAADVDAIMEQQVLLVNGVEFTTEVSDSTLL